MVTVFYFSLILGIFSNFGINFGYADTTNLRRLVKKSIGNEYIFKNYPYKEQMNLVRVLTSAYPRDCLKIAVNSYWENGIQITENDGKHFQEILKLALMSHTCIFLLFKTPPSVEYLNTILTPTGPKPVLLIFFETYGDLVKLLLDNRLMSIEHMLGMYQHQQTWHTFTRQLYTASGSPEIIKVLQWTAGLEMEFQHGKNTASISAKSS